MNETPEQSIEALRRLARGLLYDRERADDLVQDAWIVAAKRTAEVRHPGPWMAGILRNLAFRARRESTRRDAREQRAARPEALPSAADTAARIEILHRLLDAVNALDEPYRTAIHLKFFDDLPPREIARRLAIPVNTARSHVRRGLERLRRALDPGDERGRQALLSALVPFAGQAAPALVSIPAATLAIAMKSKLVIVGLAAVLLLGAWLTWREPRSGPGELATTAATDFARPSEPAEPRTQVAVAADTQETREPQAALAAEATWIVRGHVTRGIYAAYPHARLVGRVHAGFDQKTGEVLLEQHFAADERGDFTWAIAPPEREVTVAVASDMADHVGVPRYDVYVPGDPPPEDVVVKSYPIDCLIRGRVLGSDDQPLAGVRIFQRYPAELTVRTGPAGTLEFPVSSYLPRSELHVDAAGHAVQTIKLAELEPGERTLPDIRLIAGRRVRGRVLDPSDEPVEGAQVYADPYFDYPTTATGADGVFELDWLDPGADRSSFYARKPGWVTGTLYWMRDPPREEELVIRMSPGTRILGRVVTAKRQPIANAWIAAGISPWSDPSTVTHSSATGEFSVGPVGSDAPYLWVWRHGFAWRRHDLELPSDGTRIESVELVLEVGHVLSGIVLGDDGQPLPWAMVYLDDDDPRIYPEIFPGLQTHCGADGRFQFDSLPNRPLKIGMLSADHARFEQRVEELDRNDLVLRPAPSAILAGRVLDAVTGAPITKFRVRAEASRRPGIDRFPLGWPNEWRLGIDFEATDGVWTLEYKLPSDAHFRIEIVSDGYAPSVLEPVVSAVAADPDAHVAYLARGTRVRGVVVDAQTQEPLAGARVRLFRQLDELRDRERPAREVATDAAGRFELGDVPTGLASLVVDVPEHSSTVDGPFEVTGASPSERWIEVRTGATIRGKLRDRTGDALAGEVVSAIGMEVVGEPFQQASRTTDAEGAFTFQHLPAGIYHVYWERRLGETVAGDLLQLVDVAAESVVDVELHPKGTATLRGRIDYDGKLPDVLEVTAIPTPKETPAQTKWAQSSRATFAENGVFEFQGLEAGSYSILFHVTLPDNSMIGSAGPRIEVADGAVVDVVVPAKKH